MRSFLTLLILHLTSLIAVGQSIRDIEAARHYCDTQPLQRIEGIWRMTEENCVVLISQNDSRIGRYEITILDSDDCRLLPGETLGTLDSTADADTYELTLASGMKWNIECVAKLIEDDMAIEITKPTRRIKLSPYMLLSRFWGLFRFESKNPREKVKHGLVKIYPNGISDRSNPFSIRYL